MPKVLLTRPAAQAEATAQRLRAEGMCEPICAPLLKIIPLLWQMPEEMPHAVMVTSLNAVPALHVLPKTLPVYAVGSATAKEARAAGFETVRDAAGDVEALCRLVQREVKPGRVLYMSGENVAADVVALLPGYHVDRRLCYRAEAVNALPVEDVDFILLYSPRTAAILDGLALKRASVTLVCLSEAVAARAGQGWKKICSAPKPDEDSLLKTLYAEVRD